MFYVTTDLLKYDQHTLECYIISYKYNCVPLVSFVDSCLNYAQTPPLQLDSLPENIHFHTLRDKSTYMQLLCNYWKLVEHLNLLPMKVTHLKSNWWPSQVKLKIFVFRSWFKLPHTQLLKLLTSLKFYQ